MIYRYIPNCHIIDYDTMKEKFCFDENGVFETEDPKLIKWIAGHKNFLKGEQAIKDPLGEQGGSQGGTGPTLKAHKERKRPAFPQECHATEKEG